MSEYKKIRLFLTILCITIGFTEASFDTRLQELEQKGTFTVVCGKYKYRNTTHDYVGYDCKLLGGIINE